MSTKAVFLAVLVALGLVVLAVILNRQPTASPSGANGDQSPLTFSIEKLSSIEIADASGRMQSVRRNDRGGWAMSSGRTDWPVVLPTEATRSLRLLADLQPVGEAETDVSMPARIVSITLGFENGATHTLECGAEPVGGRTVAIIDQQDPIMIEWLAVSGLLEPGPGSWRTEEVLPGLSPQDIARLTIETDGQSITLARLEGAWSMRAPISAPANELAVTETIRNITSSRIERFLDGPEAPSIGQTGLQNPTIIVRAEKDTREIDENGAVRITTQSRELNIGEISDMLGPARPARFASPTAQAEMVFLVPEDLVSMISTTPRSYLSLFATRAPAANIAMITLRNDQGESGYRRELNEWTRLLPDGSRSAAPAEPVEALLAFLTELPGEPQPAGPEDDVRTLARVELLDFQGDALERLSIGYTADGQLAVRTGNVLRLYPGQEAPALLEIPPAGQLPPESARPDLTVEESLPAK